MVHVYREPDHRDGDTDSDSSEQSQSVAAARLAFFERGDWPGYGKFFP